MLDLWALLSLAFALTAAVEGWSLFHKRRDARIHKQRTCSHTWQWFRAIGYWHRTCVKCNLQVPCKHDGDET